MKILVPVDGSPFTKRMLAYLAAHDEWLGGAHRYTLLHVAPAVPSRAAAVIDEAVLQAHYSDESEQVLSVRLNRTSPPWSCRIEQPAGMFMR